VDLAWTQRCDDSIAKQASTPVDATWPQRKRTTKEPHLEERDVKKEMWTAGCKYSWRKMEAAAQNRAQNDEEWSVTYVSAGATRLK